MAVDPDLARADSSGFQSRSARSAAVPQGTWVPLGSPTAACLPATQSQQARPQGAHQRRGSKCRFESCDVS